jgi:hypothetical protein
VLTRLHHYRTYAGRDLVRESRRQARLSKTSRAIAIGRLATEENAGDDAERESNTTAPAAAQ